MPRSNGQASCGNLWLNSCHHLGPRSTGRASHSDLWPNSCRHLGPRSTGQASVGGGNPLWLMTRDHWNLLWVLVMLFGVILGKYGGKILASVAVVSLQNLFGTETSNRKPRERRGKKDEPSCLSTRRKEPREWTTTTMVQKSCYRTMQSTTMAISESLTNLLALIEVSTNLLVLIEVLVVKSHTNTMLSTAMAESRS